jgi:hypothetical protein
MLHQSLFHFYFNTPKPMLNLEMLRACNDPHFCSSVTFGHAMPTIQHAASIPVPLLFQHTQADTEFGNAGAVTMPYPIAPVPMQK